MENIKSIQLCQEWTENCHTQILSEEEIENFYLQLLNSLNYNATKVSFKLNM